jgi:hypothetical protein
MLVNRGRVKPGERLLATLHDGNPGSVYLGRKLAAGTVPVSFTVPMAGPVEITFARLAESLIDPYIAYWRTATLELAGIQRVHVPNGQFLREGQPVTVFPQLNAPERTR